MPLRLLVLVLLLAGAPAGAQPLEALPGRSAAQMPPRTDTLRLGGRTIAPGQVVDGPVVVAAGDLDVAGTLRGAALVLLGDLVVREGGHVTGDAVAVFGTVRLEGGRVDGAARSLVGQWRGRFGGVEVGGKVAPPPPPAPAPSPLRVLTGWLAVLLLLGLGTLVFAARYLEGVVDVLDDSFWRSFFVGVAGQLGVIPLLLLLVVSLAASILGLLLVPFAIVAYVVAVAGLAALGLVAAAQWTGSGLGGTSGAPRAGALRGVLQGISAFGGTWFLATVLQATPVLGPMLRVAAVVLTYGAVTAGFGAVLLSRGGTRRDAASTPTGPGEAAGWQTPTPVSGVRAAPRRTSG